jgi:hypothetical protein
LRYLCLIYSDESQWAAMSKEETEKVLGEYFAFTDQIRASGNLLGGDSLLPTTSATTVRIRKGKMSTSDGPYAETKEQLGGYYLIQATDLNQAIQIAARIPGARHGAIEVRPIEEFDAP